jgi:hypothetical protein
MVEILVSGGENDPNIDCILRRLTARNLPHQLVAGRKGRFPRIAWSLADDRLLLDGAEVRPSGLFIRFDVFGNPDERRAPGRDLATSWYYAMLAWALAHPEVALLNRAYGTGHAAKPYILDRARRAGLTVAETWITNDLAMLDGFVVDDWIVKPVDGGAHTVTLRTACGEQARLERLAIEPAFLQRRLVPPDLRIFRVGAAWFAFELSGHDVDYRAATAVKIEPVTPDEELTGPLATVMDGLGLDFGAADFKRSADSGRFAFLEVNSAPMFAAFDLRASGALCDAIIDHLSAPGR